MLPKQHRLPAKEYPTLAYKGKKVSGLMLDLRYKTDKEISFPIFGISISKKVHPKASVRNKIRRKVRSAIHKISKENDLPTGQYLFIIRSDKLAEKDTDIESELMDILPV